MKATGLPLPRSLHERSRLPRTVKHAQKAGVLALWSAIVLFGAMSHNPFVVYLLVLGCIYAILLMSQNLVTGYLGLLHLAQAAFFGLGAYGSAILATNYGVPVFAAYFFGILCATLGGLVVGALSIRFGGHYFAIVSLSFGVIVYQVLNNWVPLTRGPRGLIGIPPPPEIGPIVWTPFAHLIMDASIMSVVLLFLLAIRRSKLGIVMNAVSADLIAAKALGINTTRVKVTCYTITAALAGVAGVLFAHFQGIIAPNQFTFSESAMILALTVLGGLRSYVGSIAGAGFLVVVPQLLQGFSEYRLMVYGTLLVIVVLFFPQGLAGVAHLLWRGVLGRAHGFRSTRRRPPSKEHVHDDQVHLDRNAKTDGRSSQGEGGHT